MCFWTKKRVFFVHKGLQLPTLQPYNLTTNPKYLGWFGKGGGGSGRAGRYLPLPFTGGKFASPKSKLSSLPQLLQEKKKPILEFRNKYMKNQKPCCVFTSCRCCKVLAKFLSCCETGIQHFA